MRAISKFLGTFIVSLLATNISFANIVTNPIITQYFGIWTVTGQRWDQKFRADTPFTELTRVNIAFGQVIQTKDGHYSIEFNGEPSRAKDIYDRVKFLNPTAEIFISVVGDGTSSQFGGAANDPKFAANVHDFLFRYALNGIDIDWEVGLTTSALNSLITNLATELHASKLKLTLAGGSLPDPAYDMSVLKENLDQINVMSYGKDVSLQTCAKAYVQGGFPASKLIGGIEAEVPYNQNGGTDTLGPDGTIAQKATYALTHGLAGMMEWRLDNDYPHENNLNYPTYRGAHDLWKVMNAN